MIVTRLILIPCIPLWRFRTVCIFGGSFVLFTAIAILIGKSPEEKPDFGLSMHQFCNKYGYSIQNETVKTEDGYILTIHRIQCPQNTTFCTTKRPPVLMLHGLLGSSADFVAARNQSLGFQLANKGYDVWLGNNRGNTYSRDHVMLDPNEDKYFWDYSYHEIGAYDLPAMIDYIIAKTNFSRVTFVGMSQGSLAYLAMNSLKPEYNNKIVIANLLAPATPFYATKNILFKIWSMFNFIVERVLYYIGPFEVLGDSNMGTRLLRYSCLGPHKIANYFCLKQFIKHGFGSSDMINEGLLPFHFSISPTGASIKQFQHMVQNRKSGKFAQYDYYNENQQIYNQNTVPIYNVTKITVPVAVYFGKADVHVSVEGLHQQLRLIPNVVLRHKVPYDKFNHLDFIYATDINLLVNNILMETIDNYNKIIK